MESSQSFQERIRERTKKMGSRTEEGTRTQNSGGENLHKICFRQEYFLCPCPVFFWWVSFPCHFVLGFSNQHAAIRCSTLDACMPTSTVVMIHIKLQTNASCSLIVDTKEGWVTLPIRVIYSVLHCSSVLFSHRRQDCWDTSPSRVICSVCSQMLRLLVTYQGNFLTDAKDCWDTSPTRGNFLTSPARIIFSRHLTKVISPLALRLLGTRHLPRVMFSLTLRLLKHVTYAPTLRLPRACDVPGLFSHRRLRLLRHVMYQDYLATDAKIAERCHLPGLVSHWR